MPVVWDKSASALTSKFLAGREVGAEPLVCITFLSHHKSHPATRGWETQPWGATSEWLPWVSWGWQRMCQPLLAPSPGQCPRQCLLGCKADTTAPRHPALSSCPQLPWLEDDSAAIAHKLPSLYPLPPRPSLTCLLYWLLHKLYLFDAQTLDTVKFWGCVILTLLWCPHLLNIPQVGSQAHLGQSALPRTCLQRLWGHWRVKASCSSQWWKEPSLSRMRHVSEMVVLWNVFLAPSFQVPLRESLQYQPRASRWVWFVGLTSLWQNVCSWVNWCPVSPTEDPLHPHLFASLPAPEAFQPMTFLLTMRSYSFMWKWVSTGKQFSINKKEKITQGSVCINRAMGCFVSSKCCRNPIWKHINAEQGPLVRVRYRLPTSN